MKSKTFLIGPGVTCDLDRLVSTRLLVQANSGGGKSWAIRRLLEQTHGRIQHLVIDPEGEFGTLREKYDYVLAARVGGDTVADPRTAALLAEKLLALNVSAILDIFELSPDERKKFVKLFVNALVDAPKHLWHPALIVVDEAHMFCPEVGNAESADAIKALATRGRKRGFCIVLATQRLAKLNKDAAAECNNKLIGRTAIDVDMKRASDDLGFGSKQERFMLRDLENGEFYAFGPALSRTITKVMVGAIQTTHPIAGSALAAVVQPPSSKIKSLLPKLSDLPAEAELREKTTKEIRAENVTLKRELAEAKRAVKVETVEKAIWTKADRAALSKVSAAVDALIKELTSDDKIAKRIEQATQGYIGARQARVTSLIGVIKDTGISRILSLQANLSRDIAEAPKFRPAVTVAKEGHLAIGGVPLTFDRDASNPIVRFAPAEMETTSLPDGERAVLTAAMHASPGGVDRGRLPVITGYKTETARAYTSRLVKRGLVETRGDYVHATDAGMRAIPFMPLPTGAELVAHWKAKLPQGEAAILSLLLAAGSAGATPEELTPKTSFKKESVRAYVSRLRARGLIEGKSRLTAAANLLEA